MSSWGSTREQVATLGSGTGAAASSVVAATTTADSVDGSSLS